MIKFNTEKCTGCGLCKEDCFSENIEIVDGKAKAHGSCMECGHCYAICPSGAVEVCGYPEDGVIELNGGFPVSGDTLLDAIKARRSVRHFRSKPVADEALSKILEAGRFTATAANRQDVRYIAVRNDLKVLKPLVWESFKAIAEDGLKTGNPMAERLMVVCNTYEKDSSKDNLFLDAPVLLIVLSPSQINGGLASANIELMANAESLGVLFTGFIQRSIASSEKVREFLGIGDEQICSCMLIGYPDVHYQRSAPRKETQIEWR